MTNYIETKSALNWDQYFMLQAMMASMKSKDPATKVGCVFVDENHHQVTMGYNGMIAGIDESKIPWGKDKNQPLYDQKYAYVVHAEANAILHSRGNLKGTTLYVTLFPCHECAKLVASVGVREMVYLQNKYDGTEGNLISKKILDLTGIKYRQLTLSPDLLIHLHEYLLELI